MLELIDICFTRDKKKILDHVSLRLDIDMFYVITGPNGSGKSTLAKIIMGLEQPDSGKILFEGRDITKKSISERAKLGIGYAFQQPVQFKGITVYDLLEMSTGEKITKDDACNVLSKVGLCALEYVDREVNSSLSGGELKRIEIASVMARNPKLAIFDEPEAGIDLWSFQSLTKVFKQIQNYSEGSTLVISHQERILNIADQIILLEQGKIKNVGSKEMMIEALFSNEGCCKLEVE